MHVRCTVCFKYGFLTKTRVCKSYPGFNEEKTLKKYITNNGFFRISTFMYSDPVTNVGRPQKYYIALDQNPYSQKFLCNIMYTLIVCGRKKGHIQKLTIINPIPPRLFPNLFPLGGGRHVSHPVELHSKFFCTKTSVSVV